MPSMFRWIAILCVMLMLALASDVLACPTCKDAVVTAETSEAASLPGGFNNSIYFMLGGLFCVMGLVGTVIVRGIRSSTVVPPRHPRA